MRYLREKGAAELQNEVEPCNWLYWQAFHHLRGSRQQGMGLGPIPFSEIMAYADSYLGITCPVDRGRLVRMIMAMDNAERAAMG
ncbi:phage tail assembly chaperone [Oceaniglobus ichthyenteri]|uniref:phage tail assembly chaperone n=1 Tax=Oceaniglobus ichthyenteri TaxID=2136177 RepID=UPI000D367DF8|nr:hypothetical protein [Oceaniglobus ichthyenteri]